MAWITRSKQGLKRSRKQLADLLGYGLEILIEAAS